MIVDVAIAGLGPAGASAAAIVARSGLSVAAFDRKASAGTPVQCAEFIPAMLDAGELVVSDSSVQKIDEMLTFIEGARPDLTKNFSGHMIDRQIFDASLVKIATDAGADCYFGSSIRSAGDGGLILSSGEKISAKIIIGSDGPRSMIGAAIGSVNTEIVETRQVSVELLSQHSATDIYLSNAFPGGYGWMFPKGKIANIGIGVAREKRAQLRPALEALHEQIAATGQVGADIYGYTGGSIPVGGLIQPVGEIGQTPAILAGDAAGLANPITGAGISVAVASGRLAGEAAVNYLSGDREALALYAEELDDDYGASLRRAVAKRKSLSGLMKDRGALQATEMRSGWIAYPEYWQADKAA
ncbi:geranylgeranyl reductase [hydrothermal vent metagenome]|uniref:Geranylgeranyl reductase n=1 Tax=hydrothermal vent metagenome TaxID=652676 RepID=A0A3B0RWV6_9ZZZZ